MLKNPPANALEGVLIPGSGRSPGEGNGNPLQYSCLENPMDRGVWWAIVHRVAKSQTRLKQFSTAHDHVVQFSSVAQSCPTLCDPWTAAHQASLSITNSQNLLKLMSIELVMPSYHLILCHPLLLRHPLLLLLSIFPSIRVFSNE